MSIIDDIMKLRNGGIDVVGGIDGAIKSGSVNGLFNNLFNSKLAQNKPNKTTAEDLTKHTKDKNPTKSLDTVDKIQLKTGINLKNPITWVVGAVIFMSTIFIFRGAK